MILQSLNVEQKIYRKKKSNAIQIIFFMQGLSWSVSEYFIEPIFFSRAYQLVRVLILFLRNPPDRRKRDSVP
ncbi:MAG: hypothetical protein D3917_15820 [Candidatus Electrothrix sp. AX5]|nr:hypothetical protein [Candidatus Electrothrix sp. AX5]